MCLFERPDDADMTRARKQRLATPHRKRLVKLASRGDDKAGRALLQHALVALNGLELGTSVGEADLVALRYLGGCLRDYLVDDIPIKRALNIESVGGRPNTRLRTDAFSHLLVSQELDTMFSRGESIVVKTAQERVARRMNWKFKAVQNAWHSAGGLPRYKHERPQRYPTT